MTEPHRVQRKSVDSPTADIPYFVPGKNVTLYFFYYQIAPRKGAVSMAATAAAINDPNRIASSFCRMRSPSDSM